MPAVGRIAVDCVWNSARSMGVNVDITVNNKRKHQILTLWMLCGNQWYTSLEIDLARWMSEEHRHDPEITIEDVRQLVFCDLMSEVRRPPQEFGVREYKVSKVGRKWLDSHDGSDTDPSRDPDTGLRYCVACGGDGVGDGNEPCERCDGTGAEPEPVRVHRVKVRRA